MKNKTAQEAMKSLHKFVLPDPKQADVACKFLLDECAGSRRDFVVACPNALLRLLLVGLRIGGSLLISLLLLNFVSTVGQRRCLVLLPRCPFGQFAGCIFLIGLRFLLHGWFRMDIYREELGTVAPDQILAPQSAFDSSCVDEFLRGLECCFCWQRFTSDQGWFVNSSLALVLLRRRRIKLPMFSGCSRQNGFSQARWDALLGRWKTVSEQGPYGPLRSLEPWVHGIPPDLHGLFKWVVDAPSLLDDFVRQVVVSRGDPGLRGWANWLGEDLGSRPYTSPRHLPSMLLKTRKLRLHTTWFSPT